MNKYPYFIVPAIEELPSASGEQRLQLVRRIAAAVGDPVALRAIIGIDPEEFIEFYPDLHSPELSTEDTIDSFLDRFGGTNRPQATEIEDIITPVAVPYDLSSLEALPEIEGANLLIPSIPSVATAPAGSPAIKPEPVAKQDLDVTESDKTPAAEQSATEKGDSNLSESLAKIMIKNGNYQKALEIITEISLNNPKKSIYFADQIRFLKKLISYTSNS